MQHTHTHTPSFIQMRHDIHAFFPAFMLPSNLLGLELHPFSPPPLKFFFFSVGKELKKEHEMKGGGGGHLVAIA